MGHLLKCHSVAHHNGYPFNTAFIVFENQEAADKIVDASFTEEGICINGERVYACYSTATGKRLAKSECIFLLYLPRADARTEYTRVTLKV